MKLKTKILFGILGGAVLATVPVAVLASCSSSDTKVSLYAGQALNNVKENMLIKHKAAWTDINGFDDTKLEQVLRTNEFQPFNNYGYTTSVKLVKPYAEKGEVEVEITLSKGTYLSKHNHTFTGFLTNDQKANNDKLKTEIEKLKLSNSGEFSVTTNVEDANKALDKNISKNINELYDATKDNGLLLKNNSVQGLDTPGKVKTTLGIEFPVIQKNVYVEKEVDGTKVRSSEFLLEVKGFTKDLTSANVERFIELGAFSNTTELAKITANKLTTENLSTYFKNWTITDNNSTDLDSKIFPNIKNITVTPKKVISTNEQEGFATVQFDIKMTQDADAPVIEVQKNIFGFKVAEKPQPQPEATQTTAPTALKEKSISAVDAADASGLESSSTKAEVTINGLKADITSSVDANKFIKATLPTTLGDGFTGATGFTDAAKVAWTIKEADASTSEFTLTDNIITNKVALDTTGKTITLVATITEDGKQTQTVEVVLNFKAKTA